MDSLLSGRPARISSRMASSARRTSSTIRRTRKAAFQMRQPGHHLVHRRQLAKLVFIHQITMLSQIRCVGTKQRGLRTFRTIAQHGTVARQDNQTQTVYITRAGKKYHLDGCRYLAPSKTAIS